MAQPKEDCFTSQTVCFDEEAYDAVKVYLAHLNRNVKKHKGALNFSQVVNKIIGEWAEGMQLTLNVSKKIV